MRRFSPVIAALVLLPLLAASAGGASESNSAPVVTSDRAAGFEERLALYESTEQPASDATLTAAGLTTPLTWRSDGTSYCNGDDAYLDLVEGFLHDLVLVRSEGACVAGDGLDVHLAYLDADPATDPVFEIGIDLDLDVSTGCDGFDAFAFGMPNEVPMWFSATSCDSTGFLFQAFLSGAYQGTAYPGSPGLATSALSVNLPVDSTVAWYAILVQADQTVDGLNTGFATPDQTFTCDGSAPAGGSGDGYWLSTIDGEIFPLGSAPDLGHVCEQIGARTLVDLAIVDDGTAWVALQADGSIRLPNGVSAPALDRRAPWPWQVGATAAVALIPSDMAGEWAVVYDNGAVVDTVGRTPFGDARALPLNGPIIDAQATPDRDGYWLIGTDGGVFNYGAADFSGSTGSLDLNAPVVGMAPDPDGVGYWLVASDGGVFAFDAGFVGSIPGVLAPGTELNRPVVAMVPYGTGYLLLGSDGGVFSFSDRDFAGSLGANPPVYPVVAVQPVPATA
ncbi:MAG: hypothetical protein AAGF02_03885 [Actinomycetota bacterium]